MKKKVLLFVDNSRRDLLPARLIQRELQKLGVDARLANWLDVRLKLRKFKPDAFVSSRGDLDFAKQASGCCKVFVVPSEGGHQTKETMMSVFMGRAYWKLDRVDWISKCYLWSDQTRDWLLETGIFTDKQLRVVGNARLDVYRGHKFLKRAKPDGDFTLGLAFSAKSTSTYYGAPHWAKTYFNMHREHTFPIAATGQHEDVVWRDFVILRLMMRYLRRYLESCDGRVVLRPGPFEDCEEYRFLEKQYPGRVFVKDDQLLPEFLGEIDALLTCWSTTGIEALVTGVPVISIAHTVDLGRLFSHVSAQASGFNTFVNYYHLPKSEDELFSFVEQARCGALSPSSENPEAVATLLNQLYAWPYAENASRAIASDIAEEIEGVSRADETAWREAFPMRFGIPVSVAGLIYPMKGFLQLWRSQSYRSFRHFVALDDAAVETLIKEAT